MQLDLALELQVAMKLVGITDLSQARRGLVNTQDIDHLVVRELDEIYERPRSKIYNLSRSLLRTVITQVNRFQGLSFSSKAGVFNKRRRVATELERCICTVHGTLHVDLYF